MTMYTASDFAKAEFARHPDGRVAARTAVDWAQWAFKCAECETDEERNECDGHDFGPDGYMAGNGWVPVQENPRPLTPDAITDAMVERGAVANWRGDVAHPDWTFEDISDEDRDWYRDNARAVLTAALTEPPARPEGAEAAQQYLEGFLSSVEFARDIDTAWLADHLIETLNGSGVRVAEEDPR